MLSAVNEDILRLVEAAVPDASVGLGPPAKQSSNGGLQVRLWLYRIAAEERFDNNEHRPQPAGSPPATRDALVSLHFLITGVAADESAALDALASIWGELVARPVLERSQASDAGDPGVRLLIESLDMATMSALWSTLGGLPLQPSIALRAHGVAISPAPAVPRPLPVLRRPSAPK